MAHPIRFTVAAGASTVWMDNYFSTMLSISIIPNAGSVTVTATLDDPNDLTYVPVYFALPAPFNAAIAANTLGSLSLSPYTALKFANVGGTGAIITIVQPTEGSGGGL